jgi:hypothetical protein
MRPEHTHRLAFSMAADAVDDRARGKHGQHDAGSRRTEQEASNETRRKQAAKSDEHRLEQRHRIGPGQRTARERADEEPAGGRNDQVGDQADDVAPGHERYRVPTMK